MVAFRFGGAVMVGLTPLEEEDTLARLKSRVSGVRAKGDDETAMWRSRPRGTTREGPAARSRSRTFRRSAFWSSPTRWPRPWRWPATSARSTRCSTSSSRSPPGSPHRPAAVQAQSMLRLIGQALLAQHRVSGRVAVEEKPDVLWDRPDLERLYARLEDEYELKERAGPWSASRRHRRDRGCAYRLLDAVRCDAAGGRRSSC